MGTCASVSPAMTVGAPPHFILCAQWHRTLSPQANALFVPFTSASVCDYRGMIRDACEGNTARVQKEIIIPPLSNSVGGDTSIFIQSVGSEKPHERTRSLKQEVALSPQGIHARPDCASGSVWSGFQLSALDGFIASCSRFYLRVCFVCLTSPPHALVCAGCTGKGREEAGTLPSQPAGTSGGLGELMLTHVFSPPFPSPAFLASSFCKYWSLCL